MRPPLGLVVFVVGVSILGAEIAAARLLAPYFGTSTIVWANTIGIVLVALSAGYWYGGKLADKAPTHEFLYWIVLVSGGLLALVPFVAEPFLDVAVDALDDVEAGAFAGSLVGVTGLIAIPIFVSGAVAPYALRLAVQDVEEAGRVSGRLYALSTVGSLLGTFTSALILIPGVGVRRTFLIYAAMLILIAVWGLGRRRLVVAPAVLAVLLALPVGTVKGQTDDGQRVIHEADTEYQYARVIEDERGVRELELNEGQAVHSRFIPGSFLTNDYWDEYLVVPFASRDAAPRRVAILGNGAGTVARAYGRFFPSTYVDAVEIDGELTEIGRKYFDLRGERLSTHTADARTFLRRSDEKYDLIMVDAYRQPYVPFHLTTKEFFELARDRLAPGGMVAINVGHPEDSTSLEKVLSRTLSDVFPTVLRNPSEDTNSVVMGSMGRMSAVRMSGNVPRIPPPLQTLAMRTAARIEPGLRGGSVYTDDKAPVEWLVDKSLLSVAESGEK